MLKTKSGCQANCHFGIAAALEKIVAFVAVMRLYIVGELPSSSDAVQVIFNDPHKIFVDDLCVSDKERERV